MKVPLISNSFNGNLDETITDLEAFARAVDDMDIPALAGLSGLDPNRVIFVDADGFVTVDDSLTYDSVERNLTITDGTPPPGLGESIDIIRSDGISPSQWITAIGDAVAGFFVFLRARAGSTATQAGDIIGRLRWRMAW